MKMSVTLTSSYYNSFLCVEYNLKKKKKKKKIKDALPISNFLFLNKCAHTVMFMYNHTHRDPREVTTFLFPYLFIFCDLFFRFPTTLRYREHL